MPASRIKIFKPKVCLTRILRLWSSTRLTVQEQQRSWFGGSITSPTPLLDRYRFMSRVLRNGQTWIIQVSTTQIWTDQPISPFFKFSLASHMVTPQIMQIRYWLCWQPWHFWLLRLLSVSRLSSCRPAYIHALADSCWSLLKQNAIGISLCKAESREFCKVTSFHPAQKYVMV